MHYLLVVLDAEGPAQVPLLESGCQQGRDGSFRTLWGAWASLPSLASESDGGPGPVAISLQPVLRLELSDLPPPCQDPSDDSGPPRYSRIAAPSQGPSLTPICKAPLSCPVTCSPIFGDQWAAFGGSSGWPPMPAPPSSQVKDWG